MTEAFRARIDTEAYFRAMRFVEHDALPEAVAESLNAAAEASERQARRNADRRLIVRTRFTINSIRADRRARGTNIARMFSRVGSISSYLPIQDEGGTVRARGRKLPIPTLQARTGRSINRSIARRYRMNKLGQMGAGSKFFISRSRAGKVGIYERMARRVRMIRNLDYSRVRIKPTRWFSDAVARYGTRQFINAQFIRAAERKLRRVTR